MATQNQDAYLNYICAESKTVLSLSGINLPYQDFNIFRKADNAMYLLYIIIT